MIERTLPVQVGHVLRSTTVGDVRAQVAALDHVGPTALRLSFGSKKLRSGHTLGHYGVNRESQLNTVLHNLRDGVKCIA